MGSSTRQKRSNPNASGGDVTALVQAELVVKQEHLQRVVIDGMLRAEVSLDIMTADFKAMLVPTPAPGSRGRGAPSIVHHLVKLAQKVWRSGCCTRGCRVGRRCGS